MDINEKLASLTAEQSRALAEAMNAGYNERLRAEADEEDVELDKDGKE